MTGVRLTIQGSRTTAILSDIILTLQIVEISVFWEGILTVKAHCRVWILTVKANGKVGILTVKANDRVGILTVKANGSVGILTVKANGRVGILTVKANGKVGILTDKRFLLQNSLDQLIDQ